MLWSGGEEAVKCIAPYPLKWTLGIVKNPCLWTQDKEGLSNIAKS